MLDAYSFGICFDLIWFDLRKRRFVFIEKELKPLKQHRLGTSPFFHICLQLPSLVPMILFGMKQMKIDGTSFNWIKLMQTKESLDESVMPLNRTEVEDELTKTNAIEVTCSTTKWNYALHNMRQKGENRKKEKQRRSAIKASMRLNMWQ